MADFRNDPLRAYLTRAFWETPDGRLFQSSYWAAWRDACNVSGRHEVTGEVLPQRADNTQSWIGAVAWLCFIEQIGNAVRLAEVSRLAAVRIDRYSRSGAERNFRAALVQFTSSVTDDEMSTLWALRNSLAHDYRLINLPPNQSRKDLFHHFRLFALPGEPRLAWKAGSNTCVNLWRLGDTGVEVGLSAERALDEGRLVMTVEQSVFVQRYISWIERVDETGQRLRVAAVPTGESTSASATFNE
jgi:hypothetical protein